MELKVFNKNLELIGIVDSFSSLIWERKYNQLGIFQLNILFSSEVNSILNADNIIYKSNGECGVIASKEIKINLDGTESIEVKGSFILSYLGKRIIWGCEEINANIINAAYALINNNCIECTSERKIPALILDENKPDVNINLIKQVSYNNLLDTLCTIFQAHELGLKVDFDIIHKRLIFKAYKGIDRSINQNIVAPVIFSREFENVLEQNYFESKSNYKNVALIAGAGEGAERKLQTIGAKSGIDRCEVFIDARDIQETRDIEIDGESIKEDIPKEEYLQLLKTRGQEKIVEYQEIKTFDASINQDANIKYLEDYDLGDIVTFFDKKWGITIDTRITGISEMYDMNGVSLEITFGNNIPSLIQIINKKG